MQHIVIYTHTHILLDHTHTHTMTADGAKLDVDSQVDVFLCSPQALCGLLVVLLTIQCIASLVQWSKGAAVPPVSFVSPLLLILSMVSGPTLILFVVSGPTLILFVVSGPTLILSVVSGSTMILSVVSGPTLILSVVSGPTLILSVVSGTTLILSVVSGTTLILSVVSGTTLSRAMELLMMLSVVSRQNSQGHGVSGERLASNRPAEGENHFDWPRASEYI